MSQPLLFQDARQFWFETLRVLAADEYGGSFEGRIRFILETFAAVRDVWPANLPLTAKLGISDFIPGSHTVEESIELVKRLKALGLDLVDVSIGFNTPDMSGVPWGPAFMAPFAERFKKETGIAVRAGWFISDAAQANAILREDKADLILLAHAMLDDPNWPYHAARSLGIDNAKWTLPAQYAHWIRA